MIKAKLAEQRNQKKRAKCGWMVKYLQEVNGETDMSIPLPQRFSYSIGRRVAETVLKHHPREAYRSPS